MTYGIYSRDLSGVSLSGKYSIEDCKKYLHWNHVVCSERRYWCSWSIKFIFHKWCGFRLRSYDGIKDFGFVSIEAHSNYHTWADKIVYDPQATKGETK